MSGLTKKRVRWFEKNKETDEILHDEDVDILTSAEATLFNDGESLQEKYDNGNIARTSQLGDLNALATKNNSNLVDALNEVNTSATNNANSIEKLSNNLNGTIDKTTTFNKDGSITETTEAYTNTTVFNDDGSITETKVFADETTITKTTTFNEDGSITEVFE